MNRVFDNLMALGIAIVVAGASLFTLGLSLARPATDTPQQVTASVATDTTVDTPQEDASVDETVPEGPVEEGDSERDEYVAEWAPRIDAFNAGYPLEGYGTTFAEAAYDNGIDPRFSPAIARVESGSGQNCLYEHNAWGWGDQSWPDWESAIHAHVAGLAANYGSELTYDVAATYAPEETDEWYAQVEGCMGQI
ncbi:MAG: glucosaminidase domain-containing protein [Atopobiaceae bacterium]|nr:glucosaminidase domain-containing protein [Atopobiaceae bacterium]